MPGTTGGFTLAQIDAQFRAREIITVRCARCGWERTGPATDVSRRGFDRGMLAKQARHVARHKRADAYKREWKRRWRAERRQDYLAEARRYREENRERLRLQQRERRAAREAA